VRILIVGGGGREHALCWKISKSRKIKKVFCAPGNGGIEEFAEIVDIEATDIKKLADFAQSKNIDLTIVGPEAPLVAGIVDLFEEKGLRIFGPKREAAVLEGSKVQTKLICRKYNIPSSDFEIFDNPKEAKEYLKRCNKPQVVKADGLAAGKGVIVAKNKEEAEKAVETIMIEKKFGEAGSKVIIEERLYGEEASIQILSDGENMLPLASSQDHKQVYDKDKGENTGGMGAYSPAPVITDEVHDEIMDKIMKPTIYAMKEEGRPYKGVLYAGLMITDEGPKLLEFNVRFGDPETQAVLPRLKSDLLQLVQASLEGRLDKINLKWDKRACVCVVMASGGYPGQYENGKKIEGLDKIKKIKDATVFHAGTKKVKNEYLTNGGRVLNVCALGQHLQEAIDRVYGAVEKISFDKAHYRRDIGQKALKY
jgi:phosphoribosylamine---glycine ligase